MNTTELVKGALITPRQIGRNYLLYLSQSKTVRWLKPIPLKEDNGSFSQPHLSVSTNLLGGLQLANQRSSIGQSIDRATCWEIYAIPFQEALLPIEPVPNASEHWLIPLQGAPSYVGIPVGALLLSPRRRSSQSDLEALVEIRSEVSIPLIQEITLKRGYYGMVIARLADRSYKLQDLRVIEPSVYGEEQGKLRRPILRVENAAIPVWHW